MTGATQISGTNSAGRPDDPQQESRRRARRRVRAAGALGVLTLAVIGFAAFKLAGHLDAASAAAPAASSSASQVSLQPAAPATTGSPSPTATASPVARPAPPVRLSAVQATAFGQDGVADGDNPQTADRVVTDPATGWQSQWYATPSFGGLKQGTGLLLDLGRSYAVSSVSVSLGSLPGATLQLRVGQRATPGALSVAATGTATSAQESLAFTLKTPVHARYLLLWFTQLPPDGAGHYQAWVRQVTVMGQSLR